VVKRECSNGDAGVALRVAVVLLGQEPFELGPAAATSGAGRATTGDVLDSSGAGRDHSADGAVGDASARADVHG
jgi:hypothetical protein